MKKRAISAIILILILALVIIKGGILLKIACIIIGSLGLYELFKALKINYRFAVPIYIFVASIVSTINNWKIAFLFAALYLIFLVIYYVVNDKIKIMNISAAVFLSFYIAFSVYCIYKIGLLGQYYIIYLFILSSVTDTGAYLVGRAVGKVKLAPIVSPNKTIEGALGGIILTTIMCIFFSKLITEKRLVLVAISFFLAILSIFGDLFFSKIKREVKIKDYGYLIPGHGGILDRFDSIFLIAPMVYYVLLLIK